MSKLTIGGQAVIEGVMMRSPKYYAVAVQKKNRKIITKTIRFKSIQQRHWLYRLPIIRGVIVLFETLVIGMKILFYSSQQAEDEKEEKLSWKELAITFGISIVLVLALFKFLPLFLAYFFQKKLGLGNVYFNLIDGGFKLLLFLLYIILISAMKDVRRLFQYHGAEHMAVSCYEGGKKLTIKNVRKYSTLQPRCGTSFIFSVILISIIIYIFIPFQYSLWQKYILRILLLPVIAGLSYELIRLAGKFPKNPIL